MDIKKEFDSGNDNEDVCDLHIKQEPELIIDNDGQWTPAKLQDEEKEYYHEFFEECKQISIRDANGLENYTITFLDENKRYADDESDDYSEAEYDEYQNSDEDVETSNKTFEDLETQKAEYSNTEAQIQSNIWLTANFVEYECPLCSERFFRYIELRQHFEQNHKDAIVETEKNYSFGSPNCGVCKKCNKEFSSISFRYFHSMKHDENNDKLQISICKVCNFKAKKRSCVQKHVFKKHPEAMKEFKVLEMWYHFIDKHPDKDKAKIIFNCHLCVCEAFNKEESFLQHLAESHTLKSFHNLNFRKIMDDKEFVACTKCGSLFVQNETFRLLKHFLTHEDNSFWTCKFCSKQSSFQKISLRHMCLELIEYYNNRNYDANSIDNYPEHTECQIKNLQEFENYVGHVCPFCNKEFNKMLKWQQHLKKIHAIGTLKGLEMKKLVNDDCKLYCVICHAIVPNSPEKLNAHRFQHLPFKPYKCVSCCCALSTFQMAVNHVLKRCKDEDDRSLAKNNTWNRKADDSVSDIRSILELQCSLCNYKKFNDVKSTYKHYEDAHNNFEELFAKNSDNSVTCKICYKRTVDNEKNPCFLHIINHFDEKTFQCKLCLQSYATLKGINYHFLSHPSTKAIFQQACSKKDDPKPVSLPDKNDRATKNVTTLAVSSIKSYVLNEFAEFIGFVCPECNEDMGSQPMWHTHIATQHSFFNESDIYFKDADGSLKCTTCKMKLPKSTIQQQKHKLTHMPYKSFMCNLCYVRCNSLGVLYGHFRNKHFAKGSFVCPLCPDILQTSYQRTKHLKDKHPRDKWPASMCLICYKILASSSGLRTHMRIHDVDRFKYSCEICGAKIIELKDFNSHTQRHKKKGEVKGIFHGDTTSNPKSDDASLSEKCQDYNENKNEKNLDKKTILPNELKDVLQNKYLEDDDQTVVCPVTKKKKYASEETKISRSE